jgi:ring-1,2-phenylacetyl-CoA epoxidase subunit PaaC
MLWYRQVQDLSGATPDHLVFFRDAVDYRCAQLVELPRGDWAFSMLRQYLFDAAETARLASLVESRFTPLAQSAAKIRTEEIYHYRHSHAWIRRLGLGTQESHRRTQAALDELWPYALQLMVPLPGEAELAARGLAPAAVVVRQAWEAFVIPALREAGLNVPDFGIPAAQDRSLHSPHLAPLLEEMQSVARLEGPGVEW